MLTDILPPQYRKAAYGLYALIGVVLGAIQVAYLNIAGQPTWLTVALAVFAFVGSPFGATAASNVTTTPDAVAPPSAAEIAGAVAARLEVVAAPEPETVAAPKKAPAKRPAKKAAPKPPIAG